MKPDPQLSLKAVSEPRRRSILQFIWHEERSAGEIAEQLPVSFAAVSQHLAKLLDAGLVTVRKDGRRRFYRARRGDMGTLEIYLEQLWGSRLDRLKRLAEQASEHSDPEEPND